MSERPRKGRAETTVSTFAPAGAAQLRSLFSLYAQGNRLERSLTIISGASFGLASLGVAISLTGFFPTLNSKIWFPFIAFGALLVMVAESSFKSRQDLARQERLAVLQERVEEKPGEPQLAWNLARVKLESYLDKNLGQVAQIFWLTVLVMLFGMVLIGFGVTEAIRNPTSMNPAKLSALAGVIVQIIAGTFLIVYRSTMAQAKDYVVVLERINAVGMSINILEGIKGTDAALSNKARVELAHGLLGMYDARSNARASRAPKGVRMSDDSL